MCINLTGFDKHHKMYCSCDNVFIVARFLLETLNLYAWVLELSS
jgi:hypothetical protein